MFFHTRRQELSLWRKILRVLRGLFQKISHAKTPEDIERAVNEFHESKQVEEGIQKAYEGMVQQRRVDSAKSWKEAAATAGPKILQGLRKEMQGQVGKRIQELESDNVNLIKSMPKKYAQKVIEAARKAAEEGRRADDVVQEMRDKIPEQMQRHLKTIARTEIAKAQAAITQARAQNIGIHCYIWRTCHDERVRSSHQNMDGVLVFYDTVPDPEALAGQTSYGAYHAGCTFNCRCYQEPVTKLSRIPDNIRFYNGSKIVRASRAQLMSRYAGKTRM